MAPTNFGHTFHQELEISKCKPLFNKEERQQTDGQACNKFGIFWKLCTNIQEMCPINLIKIWYPEMDI